VAFALLTLVKDGFNFSASSSIFFLSCSSFAAPYFQGSKLGSLFEEGGPPARSSRILFKGLLGSFGLPPPIALRLIFEANSLIDPAPPLGLALLYDSRA
jgi:hypothetical protein